jgi:hypothetical protein
VSRPPQRLIAIPVSWEVFHDGGYDIQDEMEDPIAFSASSSPDVMYYEHAMKEPDSGKFEQAMIDEVEAHIKNGHWAIIPRPEVPKGTKVLPSVWAMKPTRRIATNEPYKWKARLNLHGGNRKTASITERPVIAWSTIQLCLILTLLNGWSCRQVDFEMAYPQAEIEWV